MNERPQPPPEGRLIAAAAEHQELSIREAARRAGISYGRWRQITSGFQNVSPGSYAAVRAPARTLAKMAQAVGVTPDELAGAGREDAAQVLAEMQRREADAAPPRLKASPRRKAAPPASNDPDLRPWRQQVLREAYEAAGILGRLSPGELPEPDQVPGLEEVLLGLPGALIFDADHEISAWDNPALPLQRKVNVIALTRRLGAQADERERKRRTGLAGHVPVTGAVPALFSVGGRAIGASS